jgi:hypothetical protein
LSRDPEAFYERDQVTWMLIEIGRRLVTASPQKSEEIERFFRRARDHSDIWLNKQPSSVDARYAAAIADTELGQCRFRAGATDDANLLVWRAADEFRRLSLEFRSDPKFMLTTRWAHGTLARQFQQLGRVEDAAETARHLADWLNDIAPRAQHDPKVQSELQQSWTETAALLRATGQDREADALNRPVSAEKRSGEAD